MASIHRRFKSPFWVCEYLSADGRWLKRSTKLRDRHKAQEWCRALQEAEDRIRGGSPSEQQLRSIISASMERITGSNLAMPSVRQWIEQWIAAKEGTTSPRTMARCRQCFSEFLSFMGRRDSSTLESVGQRDIIAFRALLHEEGKSAPTINLIVSMITAPLRLAFQQGLIRHNPAAGLPRLSEKSRGRRQPFSLEQVRQLLAAAPDEWRGAILAGFTAGMRLSDVSNLSWQNIDFDNGVIAFRQRKTQAASDDATVVGLHPDFEAYLKARKVRALAGPIFPGLAGRPTSGRSGLSREFTGIMTAAGIQSAAIRETRGKGKSVRELSFHSFRHSVASSIFKAKVIEEAQRRVTGHARSQTLRHYTHIDLEAVKQATAMIPRISSS